MKTAKLQEGYYQFGNKGAVFSNETHIAQAGIFSGTTLCGTPMLSTNWAHIEKHEEIGCDKCLAIYGKPDSQQWNDMMNPIKENIGIPFQIPERFGEYMIDHFTNCLPPIIWGANYVLCSEPYDWDPKTDKDRFIGFYKKQESYYGVITTIRTFKTLI